MSTTYQVKVEVFEGPFDLLLKAIDEGKIEIHRVCLAQITAAYIEYWRAQSPALLTASDFIFMAACLIELKSKGLLPARAEIVLQAEELAIEASLVAHIQEYQAYKKVAQDLKQRKAIFDRIYGRHEGEKVEGEIELKDVSLRDLVTAFQKVYKEAAEREKIVDIKAEEITLEDRIIEIKRLIAGRGDGLPFEDLFLRKTRLEVVVTFLAILELAKQSSISIRQGRRFGSILIFGVGVLGNGNSENQEHT
jgi:segregation and condensation protein A